MTQMTMEAAQAKLGAFRRGDPIIIDRVEMTVVRELHAGDSYSDAGDFMLYARVAGPGSESASVTVKEYALGLVQVREGGVRRWR